MFKIFTLICATILAFTLTGSELQAKTSSTSTSAIVIGAGALTAINLANANTEQKQITQPSAVVLVYSRKIRGWESCLELLDDDVPPAQQRNFITSEGRFKMVWMDGAKTTLAGCGLFTGSSRYLYRILSVVR